jgi:hypothetical protein
VKKIATVRYKTKKLILLSGQLMKPLKSKGRKNQFLKQNKFYVETLWIFFYQRSGDSLYFADRPLVFINSCRSNDGRRGIISPVKLTDDVFNDAVDIAGYLYEDSLCNYKNSKLCYTNKSNISFGQACNLSELFPLFSAPAFIDSLGSFVDGGYHENSGLKTTLDVYLQLKKRS